MLKTFLPCALGLFTLAGCDLGTRSGGTPKPAVPTDHREVLRGLAESAYDEDGLGNRRDTTMAAQNQARRFADTVVYRPR